MSKINTEEVVITYIKNYPQINLQYFKHEVNHGKGAALHTGIQKETGEYLVIQDDDL